MSIKPGLKLIFFLFHTFAKNQKSYLQNLSARFIRKIYPHFLSAIFIRKIYPQFLSAKFIHKIYPQNLSAKSIRKIYPQNLFAKFIRKIYPQFLSAIRTRIFYQTPKNYDTLYYHRRPKNVGKFCALQARACLHI